MLWDEEPTYRFGEDPFDWQEKQDRLCVQDEERLQRSRMDEYREPEDETAARPKKMEENVHE